MDRNSYVTMLPYVAMMTARRTGPPPVPFFLRLPADLHAAAKKAASADGRSLNGWLVRAVEAAVSASRKVKARGGGR